MSDGTIGMAIVGCGNIANRHAQAIRDLDDVRLVTVHDIDREKAVRFSREHRVPVTARYEELLRRQDVDAVLVATPATVHAETAIPALEKGKHVLVEKPIDVDLSRAGRMLAAAEHHGVTLSVVSQNRFHDGVLWAHRALLTGRLGRPILASSFSLWSRDQHYYDSAPGRGRHDPAEGGVLLNQGVHYLDLLLWLFGPPRTVACHRGRLTHEMAAEDTLALSLEFENGALGTMQASTSVYPQQPERTEIACERGSFTLSGGRATQFEWREEVGLEPPPSGAKKQDRAEPFRRQHQDFAEALRDGRPPLVTAREGYAVLQTIHAAYRSADQGARLTVE